MATFVLPAPSLPVPTDLQLRRWVDEARERTLRLVADLTGEELLGPRLPIVNPLLWEIGHVAWFQERWVLRHAGGAPPLLDGGDALYDSSAVAHDTRWDLPLPSRQATLDYLEETRRRVLEVVGRGLGEPRRTFVQLATFHEDMHDEAILMTRQTLGYAAPPLPPGEGEPSALSAAVPPRGDVQIPGGTFLIGAAPGEFPFVFDNEKWSHPVELRPFAIARSAVTQAEFAAFVEAGGYQTRACWSPEGWAWRRAAEAEHPVYWRKRPRTWERRAFDRWVALEPGLPVAHVNAHEAEAFARWSGRRLPTEAEWEAAASTAPSPEGGRPPLKRPFPWGSDPPDPRRARLDGTGNGCGPVAACPEGDSAFGCRQMIGNVWEWTATTFAPYPGFAPDPYRDYSQPWFHTHRVLRGGSWATTGRLLRNTWRNFYTADRRDVWAGFRTSAPS